MRPLMLAVARRFPKQQAVKAFRQFVCWSVRFLIAGGGRTGATEEALAKAAKEVSDGHIKTVKQLVTQLADVLPSDSVFENRFAVAAVSKNNLARYYLRALELKAQGHAEPEWIPNENIVINLEHVLPEKPGTDWDIDPGIVSAYYKRIGNMVLLQASVNNAIGNSPFAAKRDTFKGSAFLLTQQVAEKATWGPPEIEDRQKELAKIAAVTWPILAP